MTGKGRGTVSTGQLHILIVEDNDGDARLTELLLAEEGVETLRFVRSRTLSDALARLAAERYDIILLDLQLADSCGMETFLAISTQDIDTPVIVLSGTNDEQLAVDAVRQGAQDYLVKGTFDGSLALRAIRYAIERHRLQLALRRMALVDPLTGLFNRRGFDLLARQQLQLAERRGSPSCLMFADIDGMKRINDDFGHGAGDGALRTVADILRQTFRGSDILARLGGDEFVAVCFDVAYPGEAAQLIEQRLQQRLAAWNAASREFPLSLSIGMAGATADGPSDLDTLIRLADQRMYRQKRGAETQRPTPTAPIRPVTSETP